MINSCSKYQGDWDTFRFLANLFPELSSTRLQIRERSQFHIQNKRKVLFQTPIKAIIQLLSTGIDVLRQIVKPKHIIYF